MNTTAKQIEATKNAPKLKNDGSIPDFLKRSETDAQAEARRAKQAPKTDSKGLKVITPPDPKISAAIAKDFIEKGQKAQAAVDDLLAKRDAAITKTAARALKKNSAAISAAAKHFGEQFGKGAKQVAAGNAKQAAQITSEKTDAVAKINAARKEAGLRPYVPNSKKKTSVVDKAIAERDALAKKAAAAKAAPAKVSAQKAAAQKAVSTHVSTKPSKKKSNVHRYDWSGAEEKAAKGIVPTAPDMSAWTHRYFRASLAEVVAMTKAKNLKALESMKFTRNTGSPGMVNRYRKIAMAALRAAKK